MLPPVPALVVMKCTSEVVCGFSTPPSSSSHQRKEKRGNPYAGMSITRIGSEESDDDLDHEHICKKVSEDLSFSRGLLVGHKTNCHIGQEDNEDETMSLFADFMKDMPLPEDYSENFEGRLAINNTCFDDLDQFLTMPQLNPEEDNFWKTLYVMQQESH